MPFTLECSVIQLPGKKPESILEEIQRESPSDYSFSDLQKWAYEGGN